MHPADFQLGTGDESFVRTSLASLFFSRMVDVAGNASPTLALTDGIGLGVAPLWSGEALRTRSNHS